MKPLHNLIFFEIEDLNKNRKRELAPGVEIEIAHTEENNFKDGLTCQDGIVIAVPDTVEKGLTLELKPGDRAYTHHFITLPRHILPFKHEGKRVHKQAYGACFARVRDGEIKALNNWNFFEIITESEWESDIIFNPNTKELEHKAIAVHLSDSAKELGVQEGDNVQFPTRCAYRIVMEGKTYYRVETKNLEAIYRQ